MANQLYDFGREAFLTGQVDWSTNTIRAVLVDTSAYTVNLATNKWLSDVPAAARIAPSSPLASKTTTAGVAGAANVTFSGVSGPSCEAIVIYKDSGVESTSRLICYLTSAVGLPVTPNGGDITVQWDTGSNKILKL